MFQVPLFFTCIISSNLWNSLIKIIYFYNSSFIENWEKWDAKKFNNPLRVTQQLNWQQDSALIISVSFCKHLMSTGTFALRIITLRIFAIMTHKSFWPKSVSQLKPCHHKFSCVGQLLKPPCVHDSPSKCTFCISHGLQGDANAAAPQVPLWAAGKLDDGRGAPSDLRALWLASCLNMHAKSLQSCPTSGNPMDCSPPGFSVHGGSAGKNIGVGCLG